MEPRFFKDTDGSLYYDNTTYNNNIPIIANTAESLPDMELDQNDNVHNFLEKTPETENETVDIYDFSDISPQIEIQKQIVCQIKTDRGKENIVSMSLDFDTELDNSEPMSVDFDTELDNSEQLIKSTEKEAINNYTKIDCLNGDEYLDINTKTKLPYEDIQAKAGKDLINIGIAQNYDNNNELADLDSNSDFIDDDSRDKDFDINELIEPSDTDSYSSGTECNLSSELLVHLKSSKNRNIKGIPTQTQPLPTHTQPLSERLKGQVRFIYQVYKIM